MKNIIETIRKYDMIRNGMHVLAGVSGGADSVCLLAALLEFRRECPFEITVVHVEHGIRGEESLEDAAFVRDLCEKAGVKCRIEHVDAPAKAKACGLSLEEAARVLRYQIFGQVRSETGADVIAVAHNENDQAETVLWNLIRGSALKGLGGIRPVRDDIIRPLLFTPRERIEQILQERGLVWRTDRTNLDVEYTRNRLRMEILPYFEQYLNRKTVDHISEAAGQLREAQDFIESQVKRASERCITELRESPGNEAPGKWKKQIFLRLEPFAREDHYLQGEILRECIRRCTGGAGLKDVGKIHIGMLRKLAEMPCGKRLDLPGGITASRQNGGILYTRRQKEEGTAGEGRQDASSSLEEYCLILNGSMNVGNMTVTTRVIPREMFDEKLLIREKLHDKRNGGSPPNISPADRSFGETGNHFEILSEKKYTKWLSCDTIKCNVYCRKRKTGDYLTVNAQGGRKKLKDYMIDCKIPKEERDRLWLFADGSHVLWIPGFRISEAAKVTDETREILEITVSLRRDVRFLQG